MKNLEKSIKNEKSLKVLTKKELNSILGGAVAFDVNREFDTAGLFVGAAITLKTPQDVSTIINSGIKNIRPIISF